MKDAATRPPQHVLVADWERSRRERVAAAASKAFPKASLSECSSQCDALPHLLSGQPGGLLLVAADLPFGGTLPVLVKDTMPAAMLLAGYRTANPDGRVISYGVTVAQADDLRRIGGGSHVFLRSDQAEIPEELENRWQSLGRPARHQIRIRVDLLPAAEPASPRIRWSVHMWDMKGRLSLADSPASDISLDLAGSLRDQFRDWAKATCGGDEDKRVENLDALSNIVRKNMPVLDIVRQWEQEKQQQFDVCNLAFMLATDDLIEFPFDLSLLEKNTAGHVFPVIWHVPSFPDTEGVGLQEPSSGSANAVVVGSSTGGSFKTDVTKTVCRCCPLPHVSEEVAAVCEAIVGAYGSGKPPSLRPNLNPDRSGYETNIRDQARLHPNGQRLTYYHYSGHFFLADRAGFNPDESAILLAGQAGSEHELDCYVLPWVQSLFSEVDVDLAFWNCCEGGAVADDAAGKRAFYTSLLKSLLKTRVRTLICHRWEVDDCLARHFAVAFYKHYLPEEDLFMAFHAARMVMHPGLHWSKRGKLHERCGKKECPKKGTNDVVGHGRSDWLSPVLVVRGLPQS